MATLPHQQITPIPNNEPDATPYLWNVRYVEIDENFINLNNRQQATEATIVAATGNYPSLPAAVANINDRIINVENAVSGADIASMGHLKHAMLLDWSYRYDRVNVEFFTPNYTLINKTPVTVVQGVLGDDSLDVQNTSGIKANEYLILSDASTTTLIHVKAVLSINRLTIYGILTKNWDASATVTQHNLSIQSANSAYARVGAQWLSRLINIGIKAGKAVIRRSHNNAAVRLFYRQEQTADWSESAAVLREVGGIESISSIPEGFADYDYELPLGNNIYLLLEVQGEPVIIQHIMAFGRHLDDTYTKSETNQLIATNFLYISGGDY